MGTVVTAQTLVTSATPVSLHPSDTMPDKQRSTDFATGAFVMMIAIALYLMGKEVGSQPCPCTETHSTLTK